MTVPITNPNSAKITQVFFNGRQNQPNADSTATSLKFTITAVAPGGRMTSIPDIRSITYDSSSQPGDQLVTRDFTAISVPYEIFFRSPTVTAVNFENTTPVPGTMNTMRVTVTNPDNAVINDMRFNNGYSANAYITKNANSTATTLFYNKLAGPNGGTQYSEDLNALKYNKSINVSGNNTELIITPNIRGTYTPANPITPPTVTSTTLANNTLEVGQTTIMTMNITNPSNATINSVYFNGIANTPNSNSTATRLFFTITAPNTSNRTIIINDIRSITYSGSGNSFTNTFTPVPVTYYTLARAPTVTGVTYSHPIDNTLDDFSVTTATVTVSNPDNVAISGVKFINPTTNAITNASVQTSNSTNTVLNFQYTVR